MARWIRVVGNGVGIAMVGAIAACGAPEQEEGPVGSAAGALNECRTVELVAWKDYLPPADQEDEEQLGSPMTFALPQEIEVTTGSAGPSGTVTFAFRIGTSGKIGCRYLAAAGGAKYILDYCDPQVGDTVTADWVQLEAPLAVC